MQDREDKNAKVLEYLKFTLGYKCYRYMHGESAQERARAEFAPWHHLLTLSHFAAVAVVVCVCVCVTE